MMYFFTATLTLTHTHTQTHTHTHTQTHTHTHTHTHTVGAWPCKGKQWVHKVEKEKSDTGVAVNRT